MHRFFSILAVLGCLLSSGCSVFSFFSSEEEALPEKKVETIRAIDVAVTASHDVNSDITGQAHPVKICVIETTNPGLIPEGVTNGTACKKEQFEKSIRDLNQAIILPNQTLNYRFDVPNDQDVWIVVAAEFKNISGILPLIERKSPAFEYLQIKVTVGKTSLSFDKN